MASQTNSPLVLVIDDNPMNIKLMRGIMAFGGYALETALSAEEGLAKARQIEADIILMDLQLPEMDGYQATEILRNSEQYKETPILAISGYAMGARDRAAQRRIQRIFAKTDHGSGCAGGACAASRH